MNWRSGRLEAVVAAAAVAVSDTEVDMVLPGVASHIVRIQNQVAPAAVAAADTLAVGKPRRCFPDS